MPLGSVLLKPKPLAIPPSPPGSDPMEIIISFIESFTSDPQASWPAIQIMGEVAAEGMRDFVFSHEEPLRFAEGKIRNLFRPFSDVIDVFTGDLGEDILDTIPALLEALSKLLAHLTSEEITTFVRKLFEIAEHDLGISGSALRTLFTDLTTRMITRMKSGVTNGDTSDEAKALYEFGSGLQELQALANAQSLPEFDTELIIRVIEKQWKDAKVDQIVTILKEILENTDEVVEALTTIAQTVINLQVDVSVEAHGTVGAAANGGPSPDAPDPIAWYASWVAGEIVRLPASAVGRPDRSSNTYLAGFTYKNISEEKMEQIAFHTAWIFPLTEAVLFHATSLEQGDVLSNLHSIVFNGVDITLIGLRKHPLPFWVKWIIWPITTIIPWGWESGWDRLGLDAYPWVNSLGDIAEHVEYRRWTWLTRELLLSILTLINNDRELLENRIGPFRSQTPEEMEHIMKTRNNNCFEGVCYATAELGALIVPGILSAVDRKNYGFRGQGPTPDMIGYAVLGSVVTMACNYLGIFFARLLAGEWFSDGGRYARVILRERIYGYYVFSNGWVGTWSVLRAIISVFMYMVEHLLNLYLLTDGDTDDGQYCIDPDNVERNKFIGHPSDASTSPYLLPWASDMKQCVQGNMGIWSHFPQGGSGQTYAFDFSHTAGAEVLASRAGIIFNINDVVATNLDPGPGTGLPRWNYIQILHINVYSDGTSGQPAIALPSGASFTDGTSVPSQFSDGATNIPAGTLFPPYWDSSGNLLLGFLPPLHPSGAILPAPLASPPTYYAGFAGLAAGSRFDFLTPAFDRGVAGKTFPTFADGTTVPPNVVFAPNVPLPPPPGTPSFPAGTTFVAAGPPIVAGAGGAYTAFQGGAPIPAGALFSPLTPDPPAPGTPFYPAGTSLPGGIYDPLLATYAVYGHGLFGFMRESTVPPGTPNRPSGVVDIYKSRTLSQVLGQFVQQGQVIMLADSTGISAYNHLHTQIIGQPGGNGSGWTLPFVYRDAVHDIRQGIIKALRGNGVPRAFTFYTSQNQRVGPTP